MMTGGGRGHFSKGLSESAAEMEPHSSLGVGVSARLTGEVSILLSALLFSGFKCEKSPEFDPKALNPIPTKV